MSIQKLEIVTKSNEHFLFSLIEPDAEPLKNGSIVIGIQAIDDIPAYQLKCGIPIRPGEAGMIQFKEVVEEFKKIGVGYTAAVHGVTTA